MYTLQRTDREIDDVLNRASENINEGKAEWPGMTYEQGVEAALSWAIGNNDADPMED